MRRCVTMFVLLVAAATARAQQGQLAPQPTERDRVSMRLPIGWTADAVQDARRTPLAARAPARDRDDTGEFQTVVIVSIDAGNKIDGAAQQARLANDRNFSNYKAVEAPAPMKIAGVDGVMFGGTFTLGPLKLRSRQYMLTKGGKIYVITFTALESQWEKYRAVAEASVGSLTVAEEK